MTAKDKEQLDNIERMLARIEKASSLSKDVLDLAEAARFIGLSTSRLYKFTSQRLIAHYKRGRKLYFRKEDLKEWMLATRVAPISEMVDNYETARAR